jgi:POT family proton-dependent oligopeptide transporter
MGINLGAFFAPLITGFLAQSATIRDFISSLGMNPNKSWNWGFAAAGVGMTLGVAQYLLGGNRLRHVGLKPRKAATQETSSKFDPLTTILAIVGALIGVAFGYKFGEGGWISVPFWGVVGYFAGYLTGTTRLLESEERKRVLVIFILVMFSIIFWMTFEQAGSSLTLFADRLTRHSIFGWQFPSSWFQSVQPIFIIAFAPVFAFIWQTLADRQPSSPAKFALGLFLAGAAFVVVAIASTLTGQGLVSPLWLVAVYFLQTLGELCLSPVGLSTISKLSPARMVGMMLGVWFLSIAIGSYIAGLTTRLFEGNSPDTLAKAFGTFAAISLAAALLLAVLTPLIKKMIPKES